jgi:hypothetical protein
MFFFLSIDWDAAFEFVNDSLYKIKQQTEVDCFIVGFRQFLHKWLQEPELLVNFDKLFLLIIGASLMEVYLPRLKRILGSVSKEFSPYLLRLQNIRRNRDKFFGVLERIALNAGSDYWWILFRLGVLFNCQSEALRRFNQRQVTESIFKTLQENPEILLTNLECATRVVDYLVRWNEIDELYSNLRPVFKQKENYQYFLGPLLLRRLLICKTSLDDLKRILRSDFVRIAWQGWPCEEAALLTSPNETALCDEDIKTIFNQKLVDVVKLACGTPDYLLPVVVPVVENIVCQKLQTISNLSMEEYRYLAQLEDTGFNNFPQAKQEIETRLLKMTRDHLKSGSFQDVPSTKLILLVLAERKDIPFLDRPKVVDLQKAMSRLPRKFFNNLHSVLKKPGSNVDTILKPYRKGSTKSIVEQLDNHFDQLDEIVKKIQNRQVPLIELSSLYVSRFLFFLCVL